MRLHCECLYMPRMPRSVTYFSLLTPLLLILMGASHFFFWSMWRKHVALAWLGCAFIGISLGVLVQLLWRPDALWAFVQAFSVCYLLACICLGKALAERTRVAFHLPTALGTSVLCLLLQFYFSTVEPNLVTRVFVLNLAVLLIVGAPLTQWEKMELRHRFDHGLRWLYVLFLAAVLVRVLLLLGWQHDGAVHDFTSSWFWLAVHVSTIVTCMLLSTGFFCAVLSDELVRLHTDRDTDVLTQLLNRRGWDARLAQLDAVHATQEMPDCALLLADLDHFKQINDRLGHAAGDLVLKQVAHLLQQQVRGHDAVCRHGGEEFVVLLVGANLQVAQQVAERIRQQIQQTHIPELRGEALTISIGLAAVQGFTAQHVAQALEAADAQLYAAKHAGRNQVAVATEPKHGVQNDAPSDLKAPVPSMF